MDSSSSSSSSTLSMASLCAAGCGFFGTSANRGLCSKCYAANIREEMTKSTAVVILEEHIAVVPPSDRPKSEPSKNVNKNRNRCGSCNKKIGLLGFACRCGVKFCGAHRYPEEHHCGFDYQEAGRVSIRKENPICKADKIAYRI